MTDIDAMTPAELDAAIAVEVCEWEAAELWGEAAENPRQRNCHYWLGSPMFSTVNYHPSSDISQAFAAEAEIERRGLHHEYAHQLRAVVFGDAFKGLCSAEMWHLIHASAHDRCRAMLKTVRAAKEGRTK